MLATPPRSPRPSESDEDESTSLFDACQSPISKHHDADDTLETTGLSPQSTSSVSSWSSSIDGTSPPCKSREPQVFHIGDTTDDALCMGRSPSRRMRRGGSGPGRPCSHLHSRSCDSVGVAQEQRKAFVAAIEAMVRIKQLQTQAEVDIRKCVEEQNTQRCRIIEDAKTKRFVKSADVANEAQHEQQITNRREAVLTHQVQMTQLVAAKEARGAGRGVVQWLTALLVLNNLLSGSRVVWKAQQGIQRLIMAAASVTCLRWLWLDGWATKLPQLHAALPRGAGFSGGFLHALASACSGKSSAPAELPGAAPLKLDLGDKTNGSRTKAGEHNDPVKTRGKGAGRQQEADKNGNDILAPELEPDGWISTSGPDGRLFWHHKALGPAPWEYQYYVQQHPYNSDVAAKVPWQAASGMKREGSGQRDGTPTPRQGATSDHLPRRSCSFMNDREESQQLRSLLANWGLSGYADELASLGYKVAQFQLLGSDEIEEMLQLIRCRPEHIGIFRSALQSWSS